MEREFGISEYLNATEVNRKLDELIKLPVYSIKPSALREYEEDYFDGKCQKSKFMIDEAKEYIPGGEIGRASCRERV